MSELQPPDGRRISRRALLQRAGALGLSAAGSRLLKPASALASTASQLHDTAQPQDASGGLVTNYLPGQPTGWPGQAGHIRDGVGVTIGGHIASQPFTLRDTAYAVSLLPIGQPGSTPDPLYEPEPMDPTIDFKNALQQAWGRYYSFNYLGGFTGNSAISVQSYSVFVKEPSTTHPMLTYGMDVFLAYEPDPASSDPPITANLRWIQVNNSGGRSSTEFAQRACPYYFPGGFTSVYGKPACSFYGGSTGGIGVPPGGKGPTTGTGPTLSAMTMAESFLVQDTGRKDRQGKGILDIYGGVKWGYQVQAVQP
jgi:hypothetical protein